MNVYLDTEFIEGFHKPVFSKKRHFIDLISIGLVDETGREYYAISKDFNPSDADEWVKENVLKGIVDEYIQTFNGDNRNYILNLMGGKSIVAQINLIQKVIGKTNKQIAQEVRKFVVDPYFTLEDIHNIDDRDMEGVLLKGIESDPINFYGYYADYDWVLLCSLFGRMIDLPTGFPMICRDLKQMMLDRGLDSDRKNTMCPDPVGIHNALSDALWNRELHKAIVS